MPVDLWVWLAFAAFIAAMLALDLFVFHREAHEVSFREVTVFSAIWISLGLGFGALVWAWQGATAGGEYYAGYLIEKALSVDNVFVFALIFSYFAVPAKYQHRVLFWGVVGALVMRAVFIALGAELLERYDFVVYLFAAILILTGVRMARHREEEVRPERNPILRLLRRHVALTADFRGQRFFVRDSSLPEGERPPGRRVLGRWVATPLLAVLISVETSDLIFAVDSIPAIFAITTNTFIVFSSNVFALLGLRALYFMLAGAMGRFHLPPLRARPDPRLRRRQVHLERPLRQGPHLDLAAGDRGRYRRVNHRVSVGDARGPPARGGGARQQLRAVRRGPPYRLRTAVRTGRRPAPGGPRCPPGLERRTVSRMVPVHAASALALMYPQPLLANARVADVMRAGVITCTPDAAIDTVARTMAANHIHAVVVVRLDAASGEERTWGEVSDLDLVRAGLSEAQDRRGGVVTAGEIASAEVVTVREDEPLEQAAQLMVEHELTHLVVVSPGSDHPTGVVSTLDIAGVLAVEARAALEARSGGQPPGGPSGGSPG